MQAGGECRSPTTRQFVLDPGWNKMSGSPRLAQTPVSGAMVVFGASGDLARRKLFPALYGLEKRGRFGKDFQIIGFGRTPLSDGEFRARAEQALAEHADLSTGEEAWARFSGRLAYHQGSYDEIDSLQELKERLEGSAVSSDCGCLLYYLAVPPRVSELLLGQMKELGMNREFPVQGAPRLLFEKPFGLSFEDARRLNNLLGQLFTESQIYRIDHYLAKDTVQNLLVLRFGNLFLEPLWNRRPPALNGRRVEQLATAGTTFFHPLSAQVPFRPCRAGSRAPPRGPENRDARGALPGQCRRTVETRFRRCKTASPLPGSSGYP